MWMKKILYEVSCLLECPEHTCILDSDCKNVQDASGQVYSSVRDLSRDGDVAHVSLVIYKRKRLCKLGGNTVIEVRHGHIVVSSLHSIEFLKFGTEKLFTRKT